jgi:gamma-glutamyltranspeptidase/glutathione hydrolase
MSKITQTNWRMRAATVFTCEKSPATAHGGMVVTNHPLASAAGAQMLAAGGNAIDATIAAFFTLTVVEPMMVGVLGGGMAHIRLANGTHTVIDGMSQVPSSGHATMYRATGTALEDYGTEERENIVGPKSVATPGNLRGWCDTLAAHGTMPLEDVMQPAILHASRGFAVTPYLSECIGDAAADLIRDPVISKLLLPGGEKLQPGDKLANPVYAEALRMIARDGPSALYEGPLGDAAAACIQAGGGFVSRADIAAVTSVIRVPVRGPYRGYEVVALPPPGAAGVHILQMLNILEGFDIKGLGFGSVQNIHLLAEVLKIAFADRAVATGDPDFVDVPVEKLISKAYADERRAQIDPARTREWTAGVGAAQSPHTTHVTVADRFGNVVASTQTINSAFGARFMVPETGMIPNNYMSNFDPRPGSALSIAPGKRVTTSMAPTMLLQDGTVRFALGLPGGKRIFPSVMQAIVNLVDHEMSPQEAVEAPRIWTEGPVLEVEDGFPERVLRALRQKGHKVQITPHVAGGMGCIEIASDGTQTGAACWRADGTAIGIGGGLARPNVRFWPDMAGIENNRP